MAENLRTQVLAGAVVVVAWAAELAITAMLMELCWVLWIVTPPHSYDWIMRLGLNTWLLLITSGSIPSLALRQMRIRSLIIYVAAGAGSTLLAMYTFVTMTDFGPPQAFCCVHNPNLPDLLVLLFSDGRDAFREFLETNGPANVIGISAAPGLLFGLLLGLVLRPKANLNGQA